MKMELSLLPKFPLLITFLLCNFKIRFMDKPGASHNFDFTFLWKIIIIFFLNKLRICVTRTVDYTLRAIWTFSVQLLIQRHTFQGKITRRLWTYLQICNQFDAFVWSHLCWKDVFLLYRAQYKIGETVTLGSRASNVRTIFGGISLNLW